MKIKTNDLSGAALDWAVAKCEGGEWNTYPDASPTWYWPKTKAHAMRAPRYSSDWSQAGPIIEREKIGLREPTDACKPDGTVVIHINYWYARCTKENGERVVQNGETPLIAAMRCYVSSKLGDDVEVPGELANL